MDWDSTGSKIPQEVETPQEVESQRKFIGTPQEVETPQEVLTGARESESSSSRRSSEAEGRKKKKELLNLEGGVGGNHLWPVSSSCQQGAAQSS